jgi:hypothetical protein
MKQKLLKTHMQSVLLSIAVIALLFISQNTSAQQSQGIQTLIQPNKNIVTPSGIFHPAIRKQANPELASLVSQIAALRHSNAKGNQSKINDLNNQLNKLEGIQTAKMPVAASMIKANVNRSMSPASYGSSLVNDRDDVIAMATTTEQSSPSGRIWNTYAAYGGVNGDTLYAEYSDDGGQSWSYYGYLPPSGSFIPSYVYDDMSTEIMEGDDSDKILFCGVSMYLNGTYQVGVLWLNTNPLHFNGGITPLSWPGETHGANWDAYVRMTTDNSVYTFNPYIYIVCVYDSVVGSDFQIGTRYAQILDPYNNPGTITYPSNSVAYYEPASTIDFGSHTDIAYFQDAGSDSLIVSQSDFPGLDSSNLYLVKMATTNPGLGYLTPIQPDAHPKSMARLVSSGSNNGFVGMVYNDKISNWQIQNLISDNYGNFTSEPYYISYWGSSVNQNYEPDLAAPRLGNTFYLAFNRNIDSLEYVEQTINAGLLEDIVPFNSPGTFLNGLVGVKPGFRLTTGDSCLALFTDDNANVESAFSCNAALGVHNVNTNEFEVDQNYPNPFAYQTTLRYNLPQQNLVTIKVSDLSGRNLFVALSAVQSSGEHALLIDMSRYEPGIYYVTFILPGYSTTQKMIVAR